MSLQLLPLYRTKEGDFARAGRIQRLQATRLIASSCPYGELASTAQGYPSVPIEAGEEFLTLVRPQVGDWAVLDGDGLKTMTEEWFAQRYALVAEPNQKHAARAA